MRIVRIARMRYITALVVLLCCCSVFSGCNLAERANAEKQANTKGQTNSEEQVNVKEQAGKMPGDPVGVTSSVGTGVAGEVTILDVSDMFSNRDREIGYDESECVKIVLQGDTAQADSPDVVIEGSVVTVTAAGSYLISGSLQGQLAVRADKEDKIHLILDGADISCESSAALYVEQADKVFVTTAANTENSLLTAGEYVAIDDYNIDGAVFARDDITFNGEGSLKVSSAAGHGIVCKNDLVIAGGDYEIEAGRHGLQGKDSVRIANGNLAIRAGTDGIHSGNDEDDKVGFTYIAGGNITVSAGDDGIHSDTQLVISGGSIRVTESYEGLEGACIEIVDGDITVYAKDDGLNAAGGNDGSGGETDGGIGGIGGETDGETDGKTGGETDGRGRKNGGGRGGFGGNPFEANANNAIIISGGKITVNADGDGIDSNGALYVNAGEILVFGPENGGNGALDSSGEAVIQGGTVIALGASQMAENFGADSGQCSMSVSVSDMQAAGTTAELRDSSGKVLLSCVSEKGYNSAVFSCEEIRVGETYTAALGGETVEVEMTDTIYGSGMGFGPGGGFKGGFGKPEDFDGNGFSFPEGEPPALPEGSAPGIGEQKPGQRPAPRT